MPKNPLRRGELNVMAHEPSYLRLDNKTQLNRIQRAINLGIIGFVKATFLLSTYRYERVLYNTKKSIIWCT